MRRVLVLAVALLLSAGTSQAFAWGCSGHQAVGIVAERLLGPAAIEAIKSVLAAGPVDQAIKPYCDPLPSNPLGDAATWADDYRSLNASTAGWHFINFPRDAGGKAPSYKPYCPNGNCIVDAIVAQYRILRTATDPLMKANALRFVVHFVGDLHQPLHTTANGDRGGNCLPVTYFGKTPTADARHSFRPNLHGVWDDDLVQYLMTKQRLDGSSALADYALKGRSSRAIKAQAPTTAGVVSWARASEGLARNAVYGRLPVAVPVEPASANTLASCDDNNHVGRRMAALDETIAEGYADAATPVITSQIRLAGERLAAILKTIFP